MSDIVLLSNNNSNKAVREFLVNRYSVVESDFNSKNTEEICLRNGIRIIAAFVEDLPSPQQVELRRMFMYVKNVHFILFGTHYAFQPFLDSVDKSQVHYIEIPVPMPKFQEQFQYVAENFCGLNSFAQEKAFNKRLILIVDDDPVCLRNMTGWLKQYYEIAAVKSGAAAISYLGKQKPDLILLDYEMPVCDGIQTLEMIRAEDDYKNIPVVFLTGVSEEKKVKEALIHKPQGYILKNSDRFDFITKVNSILAGV